MTTEASITQKIKDVAPGSLRHAVLLSAKRFKSTWVELGKLLVQVRDQAKFEEWGYESFEVYCSRELHIRKQTADKLTRSFSFLSRHETKQSLEMEDDGLVEDVPRPAPAFEVVEVLADAEERGQLSANEYKSIRDSIWNPERPVSELKREIQERFPKPAAPPPSDTSQLRRTAQLARKLCLELRASKRVPKAVAERADALAAELEELASQKAEA